ncbi:hypothetical protein [Streptosporangium jomthongense]|uniref:FtsK domain-containing protein n=1 Tax=Streptosporangium jomthongense TaxID=1193683 RepID=A0ABV8EYC8_9ACTN
MTTTETAEAPSSPRTPAPAHAEQYTLTGELQRATTTLVRASRTGLYPPAAMAGLYGAATVLHESGAHPLYVLAGTAAAVAAGICLGRVRAWLEEAPWRRVWAGGVLAAATAWTTTAVAAGTGMTTLLPATLVVGGGLLAAPWWWIHRHETEAVPAPQPKPELTPELAAPERRLAIEAPPAPPAPHVHQVAWAEHVGAEGHSLPGSRLIDPEAIVDHHGEPNGMRWIIDGGPARHTYTRMRGAMEEIKATLDRPHVDSLVYLDEDPEQRKTRAKLVVLERNPLTQPQFWMRPGFDPATGRIPISVYPDGSGYAYYVLYTPGWGITHDLVVGTYGSGKSTVLRLLTGESLAAGSAVALFDPHGSFSEITPRVMASYRKPEEIYAGACALRAAYEERIEILHEVGETRMGPEFGHPVLHAVIDEASRKEVLGNSIISGLLTDIGREGRKLWIKLTVATQDPSVEEGFHDNSALRDMLLSGNVIILRVATAANTRMARTGGVEVSPHELPKFFDREQQMPTTGLGYVLTGSGSDLPSRSLNMTPEAFAAQVPASGPLDERTGQAWQRGYEEALAELARLAEQAERSTKSGGVALHAIPADASADPGAKAALLELFQVREEVSIADIRQARICSPSRAYDLLKELADDGLIEKVQGERGRYVRKAS